MWKSLTNKVVVYSCSFENTEIKEIHMEYNRIIPFLPSPPSCMATRLLSDFPTSTHPNLHTHTSPPPPPPLGRLHTKMGWVWRGEAGVRFGIGLFEEGAYVCLGFRTASLTVLRLPFCLRGYAESASTGLIWRRAFPLPPLISREWRRLRWEWYREWTLRGCFDGGRRRTKSNSLDEKESLKARFLVLSCIFVENWSLCGTFISIVC